MGMLGLPRYQRMCRGSDVCAVDRGPISTDNLLRDEDARIERFKLKGQKVDDGNLVKGAMAGEDVRDVDDAPASAAAPCPISPFRSL